MKRTLWFSLLALVAVAAIPMAASGQVAPEQGSSSAPEAQATTPRYEVWAGYSYTSLNQVNGSRYGLQGMSIGSMRNWGRFFGMFVNANYYKPPLSTGNPPNTVTGQPELNPGDPAVWSMLVGPEIHAQIWGHVDGLVFMKLGTEHTSGEKMNPDQSFAGGGGGGLAYNLNNHFAIRATGERIAASFSLIDNNQGVANSGHVTPNSSATLSLVYKF